MKHFTQSGGVSLAEFTAGAATVVTEDTGIQVTSETTLVGSLSTTTYKVALDATLEQLSNTPSSVSSGEILVYDGSNWSAVSNTFANLSDTTISTLVNGQVPVYNTSTSKWINSWFNISQGGDVSLSALEITEVLKWDGSDWINGLVSLLELSDTNINEVSLANGDIIYYDEASGKWVNTSLYNLVTTILFQTTTSTSNSSTAQQYLTTYALPSDLAVVGNTFEIEAHFDIDHTSDNTEQVFIMVGGLKFVTSNISSGSGWKAMLKVKIIPQTGDACFFIEETTITAGRGLEGTTTKYSTTSSFIAGAEVLLVAGVDPGTLSSADKITCNYFNVALLK